MRSIAISAIALIAVVSLVVLSGSGVAAAADAKGKAKDAAEKEAAEKAKVELKGGRRSIKDWSKLTDKDFRDLEDTWLDDEEEDPEDQGFKWKKGADGTRQPPMPKGPKMEMGFATLQPGTTKDECEVIASRWAQLLSTGAVSVKAYSIEDDKILVGVDGGYPDMFKVKDFVLDQIETTEFEWQQQKFYPKRIKRSAKQLEEEKAAAQRREKEAELRRKLESGEISPGGKANGKAPAKAPAKAAPAKAKAKTKDTAKKPAAKADAKAAKAASAKAKGGADKQKEKEKVKAKDDASASKAKDQPKEQAKAQAKPKDTATKPKRDEL